MVNHLCEHCLVAVPTPPRFARVGGDDAPPPSPPTHPAEEAHKASRRSSFNASSSHDDVVFEELVSVKSEPRTCAEVKHDLGKAANNILQQMGPSLPSIQW